MDYRSFIIDEKHNNISIEKFLRDNFISYNYLTKLRKKLGYILLNGQPARTNEIVKCGDSLKISSNPEPKSSECVCIGPLDIVYEDENILVVNKPRGLSTMPSKKYFDNNLVGLINNYMKNKQENFTCRIVGRLDKEVSGLIIVAKNHYISSYFATNKNSINKKYHAILSGIINSKVKISSAIETEISTIGINKFKRITSQNGKHAITYVSPIKTIGNNASLCEIEIETGRTHQIRCHSASIGHPLVGDAIYGLKTNVIKNAALICKEISILLPSASFPLMLTCEYDDDFISAIFSLEQG